MNTFIDDIDRTQQTYASLAESLEEGERLPVARLVAYLKHKDYRIRKLALELIEYQNDPVAIPALLEVSIDGDIELSIAASEVLRTFRHPQTVRHLVGALASVRPEIRRTAVAALSERRASEAVEGLIHSLGDLDPLVRREAVIALSSYRWSDLNLALRSALRDESPLVRRAAVEALAEQDGAFIFDDLIIALSDPNWTVRREAAEALPRYNVVDTVNALRDALNDPVWQVVREALIGLSRLRAPVGEYLDLLLTHELADIRIAALQAVGAAGELERISLIQFLLSDEDSRVQKAARRAIQSIISQHPRPVEL